jgi:hypothetical protein
MTARILCNLAEKKNLEKCSIGGDNRIIKNDFIIIQLQFSIFRGRGKTRLALS